MTRRAWSGVAVMVAGCGTAVIMAWSVAATLVLWLVLALLTVSTWVCVWPDGVPMRWGEVLARSVVWPTVAVAGIGLLIALDPTSALLVTAAGVLAAWRAGWLGGRPRERPVVRRHRWIGVGTRTRAPSPAPAPGPGTGLVVVGSQSVDPAEEVLEVTDEVTDADLCMAWRSSYVALDRATGAVAKLRAVQIRELLLDELGRRDAAGLEAWFRSGARAAGGPDRYLHRAGPEHPHEAG